MELKTEHLHHGPSLPTSFMDIKNCVLVDSRAITPMCEVEMSGQVGIKEKERGGLLVTGQADPLSLTRAE